MIYLYINYIDIFIYIHITLIYKYILYWYMPTSSKRCIFCFFRENCFFHPKCIYFWLRTISQQLYVCQKCVHIYAFETFFLPDQTAFFADQKAFFPDHVLFFRWNASLPPYQIPWVPLRNNYYNSTMVGFPYVFQYVIIQFISILCWSMCTMWIYVYIYTYIYAQHDTM